MFFNQLLLLCLISAVQCEVIKLSCANIKELVDGHNMRRLKVARGEVPHQPPAARMDALVWDEELAKKASDWAAHNKNEHNPDRNIPSKRFIVGENIYSTNDPQFNLDDGLEAWFEEHKFYNYGVYPKKTKAVIGHYTQMIWADTVYIGCGVSKYKKNGETQFLLVCNYGPPGNYVGFYPYISNGSAARSLVCHGTTCKKPYGPQC